MSTGHFTQVVWHGSTHVGMAQDATGHFMFANYAPAGNHAGKFQQNVRGPQHAPPAHARGGSPSGGTLLEDDIGEDAAPPRHERSPMSEAEVEKAIAEQQALEEAMPWDHEARTKAELTPAMQQMIRKFDGWSFSGSTMEEVEVALQGDNEGSVRTRAFQGKRKQDSGEVHEVAITQMEVTSPVLN